MFYKNLIGNVQRRATRYNPEVNKLSYADRLECLKLPTLKYRRFRGDMIQTYKLLSNESRNGLFELKDSITRGHWLAVKTQTAKTKLRRNFFSIRVSHVWNSFPGHIVNAQSVNIFKNLLDEFCEMKNIIYNPEFDFLDTIALSRILKT